jgi:gamma-glutamyltranspeptidase/glutathione hydrolase
MQVQWNVQAITAILDHDLNVQAASEAPRWYLTPGTDPEEVANPFELHLEERVPSGLLADLEARGHRVNRLGPWGATGDVQLIMVDQERGVLLGSSDPRSDGLALGY